MSSDLRERIKRRRELDQEAERLLDQEESLREQLNDTEARLEEIEKEIRTGEAPKKKPGRKPAAATPVASTPAVSGNGRRKAKDKTKPKRKYTRRVPGRPAASTPPTVAGTRAEEANDGSPDEIGGDFLRKVIPGPGQEGINLENMIKMAYKMGLGSKNVGSDLIELLDDAAKQGLVTKGDDKLYNLTPEGMKP